MKSFVKVLFAAVAACLLVATSAQAQQEDPQAQIGPNPPPPGTPPFPGDQNSGPGGVVGTNNIGPGGFTLFPNGNNPSNEPFLVILGIPNATSTSVTSGTVTYSNGATSETMSLLTNSGNSVTISGNTYSFSSASMTAVPSNQNAYDDLGLPPTMFGGASESWTNWSALDPSATSFGLFVYEIPNLTGGFASAGDYALISLNADMPTGTFVIAFGEDTKGLDIGTPFTQAGFSGPSSVIPEPSSLALGLIGLGGLAVMRFRRFRGRSAVASA